MKNGKQPAFQTSIGMSNSEMENMGLTKREYFAGLAMQGYIATGKGSNADDWVRCVDALLEELERTKSE